MSSAPCWGQLTKSGESNPLETRESRTGCTTPVDPVRWPSDGPSDPASESPPIHSRNGSLGFRVARHACTDAVPEVGTLVPELDRDAGSPESLRSGSVNANAVPPARTAT